MIFSRHFVKLSNLGRDLLAQKAKISSQQKTIEKLESELSGAVKSLSDMKLIANRNRDLADTQSRRIRELQVANEHYKKEMLKV